MFEINQLLFTKDGRIIGNAIVTNGRIGKNNKAYITIVTDYGNECTMSVDEVNDLFYTKQYDEVVIAQPSHKHYISKEKGMALMFYNIFNPPEDEL